MRHLYHYLSGRLFIAVLLIVISLFFGCTSDTDLVWHEEEGYRWANLKPGLFGNTGFELLSPSSTGIDFKNSVSQSNIENNRHFLNGSGVAVGDINGNGLTDIYFASIEGSNRLFKNLGGFKFEDITEQAGVAHKGYSSTGVVFADINGNSHLDLLITSLTEQNTLYLNDGNGRFILKKGSGLGNSNGAMSMTLADFNGSGFLDLYITNYKKSTIRDSYNPEELLFDNTVEMREGELDLIPPFDKHYKLIYSDGNVHRGEIGTADELFINKGNGFFKKANPCDYFFNVHGEPSGLSQDWGLTARFQDVTGNQLPDLYVANDFWTPDRFWINQGDGTFRAINNKAIRNLSVSSMGVDFSDTNRNGYVDIVVTEMLSMSHMLRMRQYSDYIEKADGRKMYNRNSVYLNRGDTTFAQIAYKSGLEASEWSWATSFMDVNLNGYEDLIVATGYGYDYLDMDVQFSSHGSNTQQMEAGQDVMKFPPLKLANKIFKNNRDLTFSDVSSEWGFDIEDISLGMALADLNNDGDLDLVINRFNETALVYENKTNAPRIAVRLKGKSPNTYGIGAKVELDGGIVRQSKEMAAGGSYLSGSQSQIVFAADNGSSKHKITVKWPSGKKSVINSVKANRIYEINESGAIKSSENDIPKRFISHPLFEDASDLINHRHHENNYNDFRFSPLLPIKLSRLGPGVAWIDYNRNGHDDLLVASGKDGEPALFENIEGDNFVPVSMDPLSSKAPGDQTSIIGWQENDITRIVVGSANYEQGDPNAPSAIVYSLNETGVVDQQLIPGVHSTTGPIAAADYTGNDFVDLFIGGRHKPGRYPIDADSRLYKNINGTFELDERNSQILSEVGLVTSALFSDFNQNGKQDLLFSTEWGTLKLFENKEGTFKEITQEAGLADYKGWWNGIATGDFTNNGLPDIVALNIGLNSAYQIRDEYPLKMFYDDINWDGRLNIIESYYSKEIGSYVPRRKLHDFESVSTILQNISSYREFSESSIEKIFDQEFIEVPYKEINTLEHMLFINTGDGFVARPLPVKAQFSSAFHAGVADFDNDGNEDLFISQNSDLLSQNTPRLDAGRGLILKGDGSGNFTSLTGSESGIKVYGEQRGAALSDFNRNGKTDLAISQNNSETKLYLNKNKNSGLRIKLIGPASNRDAVGSSMRLLYVNGNKGPLREIQAGSGYWSQNSFVQVLGMESQLIGIEIKWYDGTHQVVDITDDKQEIVIKYSSL